MTIVETARKLATRAHRKQVRRDGTPYIRHSERVASRVYRNAPTMLEHQLSEQAQCVAWLHDVLEDTPMRPMDLHLAGIPPEVITAVVCLTKAEGEDYEIYLARVKANDLAKAVKIADMLDNLGDAPSPKQVKKYAHGLAFLLNLLPQ